jgi:tRNA U38,U39,U40 pseudouridine synthase TruA
MGVLCFKCAANHWPDTFTENCISAQYVRHTLNLFFSQLTAEERHYGYLHQDNLLKSKALQNKMTLVTASVSTNELQKLSQNLFMHRELHSKAEGEHFKQFL